MHRNLLLILILILGSAHAARITVGPADEDYSRIQEAINNASAGDILEVHSGTYLEHLRLTKALTLIGLDTGKGMPLIDGNGSSSSSLSRPMDPPSGDSTSPAPAIADAEVQEYR